MRKWVGVELHPKYSKSPETALSRVLIRRGTTARVSSYDNIGPRAHAHAKTRKSNVVYHDITHRKCTLLHTCSRHSTPRAVEVNRTELRDEVHRNYWSRRCAAVRK